MKRRVLILGAGLMQRPAITAAKDMGWFVAAADGNPHAVASGCADSFEPIDLKDVEGLAAFAQRIRDSGGLDGIFTAGTDFSAVCAELAERFSLPGHRLEAALNATDKARMRRCFAFAGVPSPRFIEADADILIQLDQAVSRYPSETSLGCLHADTLFGSLDRFPLVVKPVDNMGARGCTLARNPRELAAAVRAALPYSRAGRVIIEEYMDGPEFSIDALVYDGTLTVCGFADRHIRYPPYFIEIGHTIPSAFSEDTIRDIVSVFARGVRALGLTEGAAKGDVKLTRDGPMIGEIAARLSGGYMSGWTFPYSSGVDLTREALKICAGERPGTLLPVKEGCTPSPFIQTNCETGNMSCTPCRVWCAAERAWISIPGTVADVYGLDEAAAVSGIRDVFPRAEKGSAVVFPRNNVEKCGNVIACADSREAAVASAEDAVRRVVLRLEPCVRETDDFFRVVGDFPPSAYVLPDSVYELLTALPDFAGREGAPFTAAPGSSFPAVAPLPDFLLPYVDTLRDWNGRTLRDTLAVLTDRFGVSFVVNPAPDGGRSLWGGFWRKTIRGGIQGALYALDCALRGVL